MDLDKVPAHHTTIIKWIHALRSGEYKQANGALVELNGDKEEGFCCLGVLCEISPEVQRDGLTYYLDPTRHGNVERDNGLSDMDREDNAKVSSSLSIPMRAHFHMPVEVMKGLINLNDEAHFTFEQIAAVVEAHLTAGSFGPVDYPYATAYAQITGVATNGY